MDVECWTADGLLASRALLGSLVAGEGGDIAQPNRMRLG